MTQQAEEENELRKKQEQALMEKLLEQEALLEQQDPKVRVPGPALEALGASRRDGQQGSLAQDPCRFLLGPGNSLLCSAKTGMRLRACLRRIPV